VLQGGDLSSYLHLLSGRQSPPLLYASSGEAEAASNYELPPLLGESEEPSGAEAALSSGETGSAVEGTEEAAEEGAQEASERSDPSREKSVSGEELSKEESAELQKLKARDQEVRTHEQAHVAAGGQYIRGGISYDYQRGPDGRSYAVGGHVDIDISEESTPEATINKMRVVKRAALAPAEPSGADRSVAAAASSKEQQARSEIAERQQREAVEQRKKAQGSEAQEAQDSEAAESKEGADAMIEGASSLAPEAPQPDSSSHSSEATYVARSPEVMNLARESRLRMMRGAEWRA
jgi:hypothetical protein